MNVYLTFNVVLGYQDLLFRDVLLFFLVFFFQSDRPTQYQETHSTVNEEKKGDGLSKREFFSCIRPLFILILDETLSWSPGKDNPKTISSVADD